MADFRSPGGRSPPKRATPALIATTNGSLAGARGQQKAHGTMSLPNVGGMGRISPQEIAAGVTLRPTGMGTRTTVGSGIFADATAEPLTNFIKSPTAEDPATAKMLVKVENGERVYEQIIEAPPANMRLVANKVMKHLKKYNRKSGLSFDDQKLAKGVLASQAFGVSMVKYIQYQKLRLPYLEIPYFIWQSIQLLMRKGLGLEGIFRVDSSKAALRALITAINSGEFVAIDEIQDSVLVGDLIKQYLQELPDPLICYNLYETFLAVDDLTDTNFKKETLRKIVQSLPKCHNVVLRELLALFYQINLNSTVNSMTVDNLAIVFSPILVRQKEEEQDVTKLVKSMAKATKVLSFAILEHEAIFASGGQPEEDDGGIQPPVFLKKLVGHKAAIGVISTTPSGRVWTCDQLGDVRVWDVEQATWTATYKTNRGMIFAALSVGSTMWLGTSTCILIMDQETGEIVKELAGAAFTLIRDNRTRLTPRDSETELKADDIIYVGEVGCILAVSVASQTVVEQWPLGNKSRITTMEMLGDSELWFAQDRGLAVFNIKHKKLVKSLPDAHSRKITAMVSLGEYLWTGSEEGIIKVWRPGTYQCMQEIEAHTNAVFHLSRFGTHVWSASQDCTIKIWDVSTLSRLLDLRGYHGDGVLAVVPAWNRQRTKCWAWSGSYDASLCIWETVYKASYGK